MATAARRIKTASSAWSRGEPRLWGSTPPASKSHADVESSGHRAALRIELPLQRRGRKQSRSLHQRPPGWPGKDKPPGLLHPGRASAPPCSANAGEKQPRGGREGAPAAPKPGGTCEHRIPLPRLPGQGERAHAGKPNQSQSFVFLNCFINPRPSAALSGNRQLHIKPLPTSHRPWKRPRGGLAMHRNKEKMH